MTSIVSNPEIVDPVVKRDHIVEILREERRKVREKAADLYRILNQQVPPCKQKKPPMIISKILQQQDAFKTKFINEYENYMFKGDPRFDSVFLKGSKVALHSMKTKFDRRGPTVSNTSGAPKQKEINNANWTKYFYHPTNDFDKCNLVRSIASSPFQFSCSTFPLTSNKSNKTEKKITFSKPIDIQILKDKLLDARSKENKTQNNIDKSKLNKKSIKRHTFRQQLKKHCQRMDFPAPTGLVQSGKKLKPSSLICQNNTLKGKIRKIARASNNANAGPVKDKKDVSEKMEMSSEDLIDGTSLSFISEKESCRVHFETNVNDSNKEIDVNPDNILAGLIQCPITLPPKSKVTKIQQKTNAKKSTKTSSKDITNVQKKKKLTSKSAISKVRNDKSNTKAKESTNTPSTEIPTLLTNAKETTNTSKDVTNVQKKKPLPKPAKSVSPKKQSPKMKKEFTQDNKETNLKVDTQSVGSSHDLISDNTFKSKKDHSDSKTQIKGSDKEDMKTTSTKKPQAFNKSSLEAKTARVPSPVKPIVKSPVKPFAKSPVKSAGQTKSEKHKTTHINDTQSEKQKTDGISRPLSASSTNCKLAKADGVRTKIRKELLLILANEGDCLTPIEYQTLLEDILQTSLGGVDKKTMSVEAVRSRLKHQLLRNLAKETTGSMHFHELNYLIEDVLVQGGPNGGCFPLAKSLPKCIYTHAPTSVPGHYYPGPEVDTLITDVVIRQVRAIAQDLNFMSDVINSKISSSIKCLVTAISKTTANQGTSTVSPKRVVSINKKIQVEVKSPPLDYNISIDKGDGRVPVFLTPKSTSDKAIDINIKLKDLPDEVDTPDMVVEKGNPSKKIQYKDSVPYKSAIIDPYRPFPISPILLGKEPGGKHIHLDTYTSTSSSSATTPDPPSHDVQVDVTVDQPRRSSGSHSFLVRRERSSSTNMSPIVNDNHVCCTCVKSNSNMGTPLPHSEPIIYDQHADVPATDLDNSEYLRIPCHIKYPSCQVHREQRQSNDVHDAQRHHSSSSTGAIKNRHKHTRRKSAKSQDMHSKLNASTSPFQILNSTLSRNHGSQTFATIQHQSPVDNCHTHQSQKHKWGHVGLQFPPPSSDAEESDASSHKGLSARWQSSPTGHNIFTGVIKSLPHPEKGCRERN